jgi:hypothetical protein
LKQEIVKVEFKFDNVLRNLYYKCILLIYSPDEKKKRKREEAEKRSIKEKEQRLVGIKQQSLTQVISKHVKPLI